MSLVSLERNAADLTGAQQHPAPRGWAFAVVSVLDLAGSSRCVKMRRAGAGAGWGRCRVAAGVAAVLAVGEEDGAGCP